MMGMYSWQMFVKIREELTPKNWLRLVCLFDSQCPRCPGLSQSITNNQVKAGLVKCFHGDRNYSSIIGKEMKDGSSDEEEPDEAKKNV